MATPVSSGARLPADLAYRPHWYRNHRRGSAQHGHVTAAPRYAQLRWVAYSPPDAECLPGREYQSRGAHIREYPGAIARATTTYHPRNRRTRRAGYYLHQAPSIQPDENAYRLQNQ